MGSDNYQEYAKVRSVFSATPNSSVAYNPTTGTVSTNYAGDPLNGLKITKTQDLNQFGLRPATIKVWTPNTINTPPTFYNSATAGKRAKVNFLESSNTDGAVFNYRGGGDIDVFVPGLYIIGGTINNYEVTSNSNFAIRLDFGFANNPDPPNIQSYRKDGQLFLYWITTLQSGLYSFYFSPFADDDSTDIIAQFRANSQIYPFNGLEGFLIKIGSIVT